jgi:hypothetical protein
VGAHKKAIDVDHIGGLRAVKVQVHNRPLGAGWNSHMLAIPAFAERQVAVGHDCGGRKLALYYKVVGKVEGPPGGVIRGGVAVGVRAAPRAGARGRRRQGRAPLGVPGVSHGLVATPRSLPNPAGGGGRAGCPIGAPLINVAGGVCAARGQASGLVLGIGSLLQVDALLVCKGNVKV